MIASARVFCALSAVALVMATILAVEYVVGAPRATSQTVKAIGFPPEWYENNTYECSALVRGRVVVNGTHPWVNSTNFLSQGGEDRFVLDHFFHSSSLGPTHTFVELGALDGRLYSNSYFFEVVMGWSGVLIEPSTPNYLELERNRPGVTTLHMGVCERPQLLHVLGKGAMADTLASNQEFHDGTYRSTCPCLPMSQVLDMVGGIEVIDYLSLDVQGHELQVIHSHDWVRYPVRVLSIEQFIGYHTEEQEAGRKSVEANRQALRERGLCRYYVKVAGPTYEDEIWINPALFHTNK
jgi:FkbM family methyltransferase